MIVLAGCSLIAVVSFATGWIVAFLAGMQREVKLLEQVWARPGIERCENCDGYTIKLPPDGKFCGCGNSASIEALLQEFADR